MHDRLVKMRVFDNVLVNGTGNVVSSIIDMRWAEQAEALLFQASSVAGTADVKFEYAVSATESDAGFGSFDDEPDILASSGGLTNPEGWHTVSMPNMLAPFVKLKVTGIGTNPADTRVTAYLLIREGY